MIIKVHELLVNCFGYSKPSQASWYKRIMNNPDLVVKQDNIRYFTIRGLNYAVQRASRVPDDLILLQQVCIENSIDMPISRFNPQTHYLYVIQFDSLDYIKVGISSNMSTRLRAYRTSHWNVNVLKQYEVLEHQKKTIELQCFALLNQQGCTQKLEKFKLSNPAQLPDILSKIDTFMQQFN